MLCDRKDQSHVWFLPVTRPEMACQGHKCFAFCTQIARGMNHNVLTKLRFCLVMVCALVCMKYGMLGLSGRC